jgi:hypothetical protein
MIDNVLELIVANDTLNRPGVSAKVQIKPETS